MLNRQTSVQMPDGRVQENLYDGEGLRAGLRESGKLSTFLYYNGEILTECNGESMPIRRRLPGMSSLQTLDDGQHHACHQDEQGSTIYITGRDGAVENCYAYDAFGNSLEKQEGIQNRIQYTGQQYDQETGQYYLRARYYNPAVGRFTQEDTYRGDGLNLYAYCKNNPVLYYDPSEHNQAVNPSNGPEMTNTAGVEKGNSSIDNKGGTTTVNGFDTTINAGKQGKHIVGNNNFIEGRSIFNGTVDDAQRLVDNFAGTGEWIGANKERVNFGEVIGQYVNPATNEVVNTTAGIIHYSKTGTHIVPAQPVH
ncbi:MAG: hypothetical protein HDR23_04930 [Lachnospiraceae bacterium]|nr:hypothetical protein [Lachnospiraceae bacterium]